VLGFIACLSSPERLLAITWLFGSALLRFSDEPHDKAVAAPNFNVVPLHKPFGIGYGFAIVATDERFKSYEVPVVPNHVRAVFLHGL
jgi:hypothetical protein